MKTPPSNAQQPTTSPTADELPIHEEGPPTLDSESTASDGAEVSPDRPRDAREDAFGPITDCLGLPSLAAPEVNSRPASMPTSEDVKAWIGALTMPYLELVDGQPAGEWFSLFDAHRHDTPSSLVPEEVGVQERWASELTQGEEDLLRVALDILGGNVAGLVARAVKAFGTYPAEFEWSLESQYRSTTERLMDRLRINHTGASYDLRRTTAYVDGAGLVRPEQTTLFAKLHDDNPWRRFVRHIGGGDGVLSTVRGLGEPTSFAFPLEWVDARESGLFPGVKAVVPEPFAGRVREMVANVGGAANHQLMLAHAAQWMEEERVDKRLRGRLLNFGHPFTTLQYGLVALGADTIRAAMEPLADAVQRGTPLDQTLKHLVQTASVLSLDLDFDFVLEPEVLGIPLGTAIVQGPNFELDLGPALTGLPTRRRSELVIGLEPRGEGIQALAGGSISPMVLLGDRFSGYAELFGGFEMGEYSSSERRSGSDERVQRAFEDWWNAAAPCRDVAMVFDLVGEVVEKLMHLDDEILALSEVALGEGTAAAWVRSFFATRGLHRLSHAVDGLPPAVIAKYAVRQMLTDNFIEHFVEVHGANRECLYQIFCWMNTGYKRAVIDNALGQLMAIPMEEALDSVVEGYDTGSSLFLDLVSDQEVVYVRKAFLSREIAPKHGALGRVIDAYLDSGFDPVEFDARLDVCDPILVDRWLKTAVPESLLGMRERSEVGLSDSAPTSRPP